LTAASLRAMPRGEEDPTTWACSAVVQPPHPCRMENKVARCGARPCMRSVADVVGTRR
jgi:hypothetical protein